MAVEAWTIKWRLGVEGSVSVTVEGEMPPWDGEPDSWGQRRAERRVVPLSEPFVIGEDVLLEAMHGHVERLANKDTITANFLELDASPDEVGNALAALVDVRDDGSVEMDRKTYFAAALDGFAICARAFRIAQQRQET